MAYVCTHVQDDASYTPYVDAMFATLSGAGWELHDDINSTKRAYRSKGENDAYCYGYMLASLESTYYLELRIYQDWNSSTHVGIAGTYYYAVYARVLLNLHKPVIMYCNKNFLFMWSTQGPPADSYVTFAGMLSEVLDTTLTTTVSGISAGSLVTVPVLSSGGFIKGARYKLVGVNQEGREVVTVSDILDSTSLVVSSLSYTYASGTYFGKEPCPIYNTSSYSSSEEYYGFGYNPTYSTVDGTGNQTNITAKLTPEAILTKSYLDPDPTYSLYGLAPIQFYEYSVYSYIGYMDDVFYTPVAASFTAYGGVYMNSDLYTLHVSSVYAVVSATANTVTLSSVSFDIDEFQNKIIVIAVGNSAGHTRKIVSNTSDTITVGIDWYFDVNVDDSVVVCDEVYRPIGIFCFKEVI
jgi:hypothetical protein